MAIEEYDAIIDEPLGFDIPQQEEVIDDHVQIMYAIYKDKKWKYITDRLKSGVVALENDLKLVPRADFESLGKAYALVESVRSVIEPLIQEIEETGAKEANRRRAKKS